MSLTCEYWSEGIVISYRSGEFALLEIVDTLSIHVLVRSPESFSGPSKLYALSLYFSSLFIHALQPGYVLVAHQSTRTSTEELSCWSIPFYPLHYL